MLGWRQGIRIAEFAMTSRVCGSHSLQLMLKPVTCRLFRSASTLVGYHDRTAERKDTDVEHTPVPWHRVACASDTVAEKHVSQSLRVYEDFISEDEEKCLFDEVEPYLRRLKYEHDHWDDVSDLIFTYVKADEICKYISAGTGLS